MCCRKRKENRKQKKKIENKERGANGFDDPVLLPQRRSGIPRTACLCIANLESIIAIINPSEGL